MKQKLTATLGCLILSCALYAQNGWLPTVTFPPNTNVCDGSPWKLVFFDDFSGNTLSNKWLTAVTYDEGYLCRNGINAVPTAEHEYHSGARYNEQSKCLYLKENIVVSNGTCKLLMKYAHNSTWTVRDSGNCSFPLVTQTADLTSAIIKLPQENNTNGAAIGYSSGKFEARIKIPEFNGAWTAFWMWFGRGGVDEIDVTETWAGPGLHPVHFNTVAWRPPAPAPPAQANPYNLPNDVHLNNQYPYQAWHNYLLRNYPGIKYLRKGDWHTYTCVWDSASLTYQLDNEPTNTIWKYYTRKTITRWYGIIPIQYSVTVGSACIPDANVNSWAITYGYPWNNNTPNCDVRFECKFSEDANTYHVPSQDTPHLLGQMEIDYLKIWQRHPEKDNHIELCADNTYPATPTISGPNEVCGQVCYTLSPATTGSWSSFNDNVLLIVNPTSSGCDVAKQAGPAFNYGGILFRYGNGVEGCPLKTVTKGRLYCNHSTDWQILVPTVWNNHDELMSYFISELYYKRDISDNNAPVVTWNVSINTGQDSYDERTAEKYTLYGQYASMPAVAAPKNGSYNIKWTMNVTDASGTWSRSGERNSKTALNQQEDDENTYYVNAYIDDQDRYDETVYNSVAATMVSEDEYNDTLYMNEMIEKIKAEALEPYIISDDLKSSPKPSSGREKPVNEDHTSTVPESKLRIYPNPVQSNITIIADSRFTDKQSVTINVYDLIGKLIKSGKLDYRKGNIMTYDLSDVADGNYILELKQGNINEHIKITKAKS